MFWTGFTRPPRTFPPYPCPIAKPAQRAHYVIPCSNMLDPPYSWQHQPGAPTWWNGCWPMPRLPWQFESETRAPGTGLITGPPPCPPCPPSAQPVRRWG